MTNDSSLGGAVTHSAFDFESQKGITILLASLRESDLTKQQKNEIRDLVFEYTSGGRDETTKLTLEQKIKSFNLQSIKPAEKNSAADKEASPAKPFGMSRPSPSFSPAAVQSGLGHSAQSPIPTPTEVSKPQPQPEPEPEPVGVAVMLFVEMLLEL
jgi:predicted component of type VI protein secretion system